mmetsp:Transcript_38613/g.83562  ORF Transcript_38613/g.83562 Transcript_38613/m.83562 type:complete len:405 (+) Transcript_38613:120-1334(+)
MANKAAASKMEEELEEQPSSGNAAKDAQAERKRHSDSMPVTRKNLEEIANFIQKKSFQVSEESNVEVRDRLLQLLKEAPTTSSRGEGERAAAKEQTKETLQKLCDTSDELARETRAAQDLLLAEVRELHGKLVEEAIDQRTLSDVVRRELVSWQTQAFPKTMVESIGQEDFAEALGEQLAASRSAAGHGGPSKQEVKEVLKADLLEWYSQTVQRELPTVFQRQAAESSRRALNSAMEDLMTRSTNSLERMLQQARATAQAQSLKEKSEVHVRQTIRRHASMFEATLRASEHVMTPEAVPMSDAEVEDLTARFRRKLREGGGGLQEALDEVQTEVDVSEQILKRCEKLATSGKAAKPPQAACGPSEAAGQGGGGGGEHSRAAAVLREEEQHLPLPQRALKKPDEG